MLGSYTMFHYVRGVPFDFNSGAYDNLNLWEQIDNGDQYTPAKKFLLFVPVALFLLSTHYTHYDAGYFAINFLAVIAVVIPKLPFVSEPFFSMIASLTVRNLPADEFHAEPPNADFHLFRTTRGPVTTFHYCEEKIN